MKDQKHKLRKRDGFTLVEMLIVVAIIAILIAVSVPLAGSALERAAKATDAANERSAKAAATILYLSVDGNRHDSLKFPAVYDVEKGVLIAKDKATKTGYGKCKSHKGGYIEVILNKDYDYTDSTMELFTITWDVNGTSSYELDSEELITGN